VVRQVSIQLLEFDRDHQQLLDGGPPEHSVDDDLLTRELPVHFKVRSYLGSRFGIPESFV
jgi:hypothetical protein